MEVGPQLAGLVILDARICLLVQAVEGPRHNVVEFLGVHGEVRVQPLRLLDQLNDICARAFAVREPGSRIPCQAEESDHGRPAGFESFMIARFIVATHLLFLGKRSHDGSAAIRVEIDPRFVRGLIASVFLFAVVLNPFWSVALQGGLVHSARGVFFRSLLLFLAFFFCTFL